jgi:muconolactone delta-isomerase
MQYLIQMRLASSGRPTTSADGITFIERFILPTLERCKTLLDEKKIVAGGPMSGAVALVMIVNAESEGELDDVITRLPIWPRMETDVTPLSTFEGRALALRHRLEQLKADVQRAAGESAG